MKAMVWRDEALGAKFGTTSTSRPTCSEGQEYREKLIEAAVEMDDDGDEKPTSTARAVDDETAR
jgi:elongation factor G